MPLVERLPADLRPGDQIAIPTLREPRVVTVIATRQTDRSDGAWAIETDPPTPRLFCAPDVAVHVVDAGPPRHDPMAALDDPEGAAALAARAGKLTMETATQRARDLADAYGGSPEDYAQAEKIKQVRAVQDFLQKIKDGRA